MSTYRGRWKLLAAALLCASAGCVTQTQHDAIARANLQLQDKLSATQAERLKTRTQLASLRQELAQARQSQADANARADGLAQQVQMLQTRLDMQAERRRAAQPAPTSQPDRSLSQQHKGP